MLTRCAAAVALLGLMVSAAQAKEEVVSAQVVRALSQAPFYVAQGKGYFEKEGIKVEASTIRSALDTIGPLASGQLDVSMGAATAGFFNAANRGFDLRIVAALGIQGPAMSTPPMVRTALWKDGTIKSGKDLRGRKIGINAPGDITEYFLTRILEKYGMTMKDINPVSLPFAQQMVAFKTGAIDAGFLPEPLATTAVQSGEAQMLQPEIGIGTGTPTSFAFFGLHFMQERPKVALAFTRALVRAARDLQGPYNKNPEMASIIAQAMGLKVEAVEDCNAYAFDPNLDIVKYENLLRGEEAVHRKNGRLNYAQPLAFDKVIDAKLVHEAAAGVK